MKYSKLFNGTEVWAVISGLPRRFRTEAWLTHFNSGNYQDFILGRFNF